MNLKVHLSPKIKLPVASPLFVHRNVSLEWNWAAQDCLHCSMLNTPTVSLASSFIVSWKETEMNQWNRFKKCLDSYNINYTITFEIKWWIIQCKNDKHGNNKYRENCVWHISWIDVCVRRKYIFAYKICLIQSTLQSQLREENIN